MRSRFPAEPKRRPRRGAALYVMVVGLTVTVSAIGFSALTVSRLQLRDTTEGIDRAEAQLLASSAVENALAVVNTNANWRDDFLHGVEYPSTPVPLGTGAFTWKLVDDDGVLNDDPNDSVRVYGIGRVGRAVSVKTVQFQASGLPLTCLEASAHAGNDVQFTGVQVAGNQVISANNGINASSSNIAPAVEAVNFCNGGSYDGGANSGITPRTMPDTNSVFDFYVANGTPISYDSLDSDTGGAKQINRRVLSPGTNPYGTGETNPAGIYVIDERYAQRRIDGVSPVLQRQTRLPSHVGDSSYVVRRSPPRATTFVQPCIRFPGV